MVAETLTASPLPNGYTQGPAGCVIRSYYTYEIAADSEDGDIWELGYIPKYALVTGGAIVTDDIDTGTEAIDIDLGWAAAGASTDTWKDPRTGVTFTNAAATADPDGFVNTGVLTGDAITDLAAAGTNYRPILLPVPLWFSEKTKLQIEANAAAGTFTAGTFGVYLEYSITG